MFHGTATPPTLPFRASLEGFGPVVHQVRWFTSESQLHRVNPSHLKLSGGGYSEFKSLGGFQGVMVCLGYQFCGI